MSELLIRPHLERPLPGTTCYYFRTPVWKLLGTVRVLASFSPPIVEFCPSFVGFLFSDFYGAAPFATVGQ